MFWFHLVYEYFYATVEIRRNQYVTPTTFGMLLHHRIRHLLTKKTFKKSPAHFLNKHTVTTVYRNRPQLAVI
jgi:hypothetical protein